MNKPVKVKFQECTKDEYDALGTYQNNTVYSCYDTGELFKGDIAFSGGEPSPGPSGEDFIVTYTNNGGTITATHDGEPVAFADIIAAYEAGKHLVAKYVGEYGIYIMYLSFIGFDDGAPNNLLFGSVIDKGGSKWYFASLKHGIADNITFVDE